MKSDENKKFSAVFETRVWRYSIFNEYHFGVVIAANEREAKRKLLDYYFDKAVEYQNKSTPTVKGCHIELWLITDDDYYYNGVYETS